MGVELRSQWGSLSENLIARLYPVQHDDENAWSQIEGSNTVAAPITDCTLQATMQWNSPFEAIGAAQKLPLLSGLLQSGGLNSALSALAAFVPDEFADEVQAQIGDVDPQQTLRELETASGITVLNSTQIFSGMQPLKFPATLHFRAWADPAAEVADPINQLMRWALPQKLSTAGFLQNLLVNRIGLVRSLFPSRAPQILGFNYAGMSVLPVVIEDISQPITAPRDETGARVRVAVNVQFATLAAIDQETWQKWQVR